MIRQFELVERVKAYDPHADEEALNRAYVFAMMAHGAQKRASGDPYFSHPLEVAGILTDYHLDTGSIITALLHDTLEDTSTTLKDIEKQFGIDIAHLVDGVTKLTRIEFQSDQSKQAENFRKLLLAMSKDIRVLLVKLADRLHNMRTLHYLECGKKRRRISLETMEIYAPLAERIGMQEIKNELEDIAFSEISVDARRSVTKRLSFLRSQGDSLIPEIENELKLALNNEGIIAKISGREKTPYSIWRKMQKKEVSFEQLSDVMAFRVVVDTVKNCYATLGILHSNYSVVPGRFKDYMSTPKSNGYRSLHTGIIGPKRHRIEIQIRTRDSHKIAELGVAAHWQYKQGYGKTDGMQYHWLRQLLEILEHASGPEEFLEHTKMEMFQDQVFCFTPRGDLINLPQEATSVDFAYAVHSEIGDTCVGAKINGRMMPLSTELKNGDQVEVLTSNAQTPAPTWEQFIVTAKARAHIRRHIRSQERSEYLKLGASILNASFTENGLNYSEKGINGVTKRFKASNMEDLIAEVGAGHIIALDVVKAVYPSTKGKVITSKTKNISEPNIVKDKSKTSRIPIKGLTAGMAVHYATCCSPLPGDRIVGILAKGKGVEIHTIDCETLTQFHEMVDDWLDVTWEKESKLDIHVGRVALTVLNSPGSLGDICSIIASQEGNISNLKIISRSIDFFDMSIDIEVHSVRHLTNIIAALRASTAINTVERARN